MDRPCNGVHTPSHGSLSPAKPIPPYTLSPALFSVTPLDLSENDR